MAFNPRTKVNTLEVFPSTDQNKSVDNEDALFAALLGPVAAITGPTAPGVIKAFVKNVGLADNVASTVFRIFTTNETGSNDAGAYSCVVSALVTHGTGPTGEVAAVAFRGAFARAINGAGSAGNAGTVVETESGVGASTVATKGIASVTMGTVEVNEYETSVYFTVDLNGTSITTANVYAMVELIYCGFTTAPTIVSEG